MKVLLLGNDTEEEIKKRIQIVASAGNLSRSTGTVTEVFEKNDDYEKNLKLARAVIGFGHKSISEHDYLVFALENVTPIVEQTIIEYRLTSYTIKSRRNVDFRNVGFYVPEFKDKNGNVLSNNLKLQEKYKSYMQSLFDSYGKLVDAGIPVEDSRYILPYSYYSNIIMGCDANELLAMTTDLLYGKYANISELYELGLKFKDIILTYVPYLSKALENESSKDYYNDHLTYLDNKYKYSNKIIKKVSLTNYVDDSDNHILTSVLINRFGLSYNDAYDEINKMSLKDKKDLFASLMKNKNLRELEQVSFSFEIPISLAVLTHLTRHRMQSLLVPNFVPLWDLKNYIVPNTLNEEQLVIYNKIFKDNIKMRNEFIKQGVREEDLVYFYLSGNKVNVYTTINGRELRWISKMRCCNKAQWEIRNVANSFVKEVKKVAPLYANYLGPTCKIEGFCPEGKDSCKNRGVVILKSEK